MAQLAQVKFSAGWTFRAGSYAVGTYGAQVFLNLYANSPHAKIISISSSDSFADFLGDVLQDAGMALHAYYYTSGNTQHEIGTRLYPEPFGPDVNLGLSLPTGQVVRSSYPLWRVSVQFQSSTWDGVSYANDGAITIAFNGITQWSASGLTIDIPFDNNKIDTDIACVTDADNFWCCGGTTALPTFSGPEQVPTSANLVLFDDFNSDPTHVGWSSWIQNGSSTGPNMNPVAGLNGTMGFSVYDTDPITTGARSSSTINFRPERGLSRTSIDLTVPDSPGAIHVVKVTDVASSQLFTFTAGGGLSPTSFQLSNGGTEIFPALAAGSGYSIMENDPPSPWGAPTYVVSNSSPHTNITVGDGETVTVTVTNHSGAVAWPISPPFVVDGVPVGSGMAFNAIRILRRSPHMTNEQMRVFYHRFQLDLQPGIGNLTGQGVTPLVMLRYSDDGGFTWSNEIQMGAGAQGQYLTRVYALMLGSARDRVWEVSTSDPNKWVWIAAYLESTTGTS